jgi:hypothetical protein
MATHAGLRTQALGETGPEQTHDVDGDDCPVGKTHRIIVVTPGSIRQERRKNLSAALPQAAVWTKAASLHRRR